jgi:hypothetical protein
MKVHRSKRTDTGPAPHLTLTDRRPGAKTRQSFWCSVDLLVSTR